MTQFIQAIGDPANNMRRIAVLFLTLFALVSLLHAQTGKGRARHSTPTARTFHGQALSTEDWTRISDGRLFVNVYDPAILVRLENSQAELSIDNGETFDAITVPVENTEGLRFYFEANESAHLYAQSASGLIFFSPTLGDSWTQVPLPEGFEPGKPVPFATLNDGETRLLMGGPLGVLVAELSEDGDGDPAFGPWTPISDFGPVTAIAVSLNQDALAAGTESGSVHTTEDMAGFDPGVWISSPLRSGAVSVLEFSPSDPQRLLAGFASPGEQDDELPLYYTESGGRFWQSVAGTGEEALPNEPILGLAYSEEDDEAFLVYAVTPSGVYVTGNFITWALEAGLPEGEPVIELHAAKGRSAVAHTPTATLAAAPPAATVRCTYVVSPLSVKIDANGGNVEISVNANSSTCARTVSKPSSTSPLKIVSGATGYGDGKVVLSVAPNTTTKSRTMTITITGKRVTITQAAGTAAPCVIQLLQGVNSYGWLDGEIGNARKSFKVGISAPSGCAWKFTSTPSGVSFSPSSGSGSKTVTVTVSANSNSSDRVFTISIAGASHRLVQKPAGQPPIVGPGTGGGQPACTMKVNQASFPNTGGTGSLEIVRSASCGPVTLRSSASWLTLSKTLVSENGMTIVSFRVTGSTSARTANITATTNVGTVTGSSITVTQSVPPVPPATCTAIRASLADASVPATGGTARLTVQFTGSCQPATVTSNQTWARVTMSGDGLATIEVQPNNTSVARSATLTVTSPSRSVTGGPFTIRQAAGSSPQPSCTITLSRTSIDLGTAAGSVTVNIGATRSDCSWTAGPVGTTSDPRTWVRINRTSGTGPGTLTISYDAAAIQGRQAEIPIAGMVLTVRQPAGIPNPDGCRCTGPACGANMQMSIDRSQIHVGGGDTTIRISTLNTCQWDLNTTSTGWITFLDPPRGTGNGTVRVRVQANTTGGTRTAEFRSPQATPAVNGSIARATLTQAAR